HVESWIASSLTLLAMTEKLFDVQILKWREVRFASPSSPSLRSASPDTLRPCELRAAAPGVARKGEAWCPWPESNQHSLRNSILSRARLPVPPQGHSHSPWDQSPTASAKPAEYSWRSQGVNPRGCDFAPARQAMCRRIPSLPTCLLQKLLWDDGRDD